MAELLRLLPTLLGLLVIVGVGWLIAWKLGLLEPRTRARDAGPDGTPEDDAAPALGYRATPHVLSDGERAFFPVLQAAVQSLDLDAPGAPRAVWVLPSVRLANILEVDARRNEDRSAWTRAHNRIASKQVDFVLVDAATTRPLVVIELDDATHARPDRRSRDDLLDRACAGARLPILHVPAARGYAPRAIADDLRRALGLAPAAGA